MTSKGKETEMVAEIIYDIFRQKAHGFNRGMNATCM